MQENTGLTLSEVKGLLANLNDNLSGKDGIYWFEALKKLLRKEEIPLRTIEVIKTLNPLRLSAKEKLEKLSEYLMTIPVVHKVTICDEGEEGDILNINVLPNLMSFVRGTISEDFDSPCFTLAKNHEVFLCKVTDSDEIDGTFNTWSQEDYESIDEFCKALLELGKMYEQSVPTVSGI